MVNNNNTTMTSLRSRERDFFLLPSGLRAGAPAMFSIEAWRVLETAIPLDKVRILGDPEVTANIYCKSRNLPNTDTQN